MAFAPDGRLFVCQQGGALRVIKNGTLLGTPFLTVGVNSSGERGLLGVAFDPDFANNNFVYIYYTATSPTVHNRVSRFTANGDVSTGTEDILMDLETLSATNHNGGAIHFGSDGMLYIATGENAVTANAQSFNNRLGKILRINSDGSIPLNPFDPQTTGLNKAIWAMGLRNPFTFNFHPANGRMHINDVGAGAWEEVYEGIPGANYGWSFHEGFGGAPTYNDPLVAYHHSNGTPTGRAITGGAFYTGNKYPGQFADSYFYADFTTQWIYHLPAPGYNTQTPFGTNLGRGAVDLQVWDGELHYLTRGGAVYRIEHSSPSEPDLTMTSVVGPIEGRIGQTINVASAVAQNAGTVGAAATQIGFYFSDDPAGAPAQVATGSTCSVPVLAGSASHNCVSTTVQVPNVIPGPYSLVAIVDDNDAVPESNETNNALADANQITLIDCSLGGPEDNCIDGIDNDCDDLVDSGDPDCQTACTPTGDACSTARECCSGNCKGGGRKRRCRGEVTCTPTESPELTCDDGVDNDCDGFTDVLDSDCECDPTEGSEVSCNDGVDNDCDGSIDLNDSDCAPMCMPKGPLAAQTVIAVRTNAVEAATRVASEIRLNLDQHPMKF